MAPRVGFHSNYNPLYFIDYISLPRIFTHFFTQTHSKHVAILSNDAELPRLQSINLFQVVDFRIFTIVSIY